jgi:hypothetical protein
VTSTVMGIARVIAVVHGDGVDTNDDLGDTSGELE